MKPWGTTTVEERFWKKIEPPDQNGCWIWTGGRTNYGRFWDGSRSVLAHRYSYELRNGPAPPELQMDHLCKTPYCVNPDHLEPVTPKVHGSRSVKARQTHCHRGHEFTPENTFIKTNGTRGCRTCRKIWSKANWERNGDRRNQVRRTGRKARAQGLYRS